MSMNLESVLTFVDPAMRTGFIGIHYWDVPATHDSETAFKWGWTMGLLYNPALALAKIAAMVF